MPRPHLQVLKEILRFAGLSASQPWMSAVTARRRRSPFPPAFLSAPQPTPAPGLPLSLRCEGPPAEFCIPPGLSTSLARSAGAQTRGRPRPGLETRTPAQPHPRPGSPAGPRPAAYTRGRQMVSAVCAPNRVLLQLHPPGRLPFTRSQPSQQWDPCPWRR